MNNFPKSTDSVIDTAIGFHQVDRIKKLLKDDMGALPEIQEIIERGRKDLESTPYGRELIEHINKLSK